MGAYTTISATIKITKDDFVNFMSERYHTLVTLSDNHMSGFEVNVFPFEDAFDLEENADGIRIYDYTSAKFVSYEDGMKTIPSFFMITDACKKLGDATLVVSPYQDELPDAEREGFYRGEAFPAKTRAYIKQDDPDLSPVKKCLWYFVEKVLEKKGDSATLTNRFFDGPRRVYEKFSNLFKSSSVSDHRVFYNALLLWYWCAKNGIDGDFSKLTVAEFCRFASEMESQRVNWFMPCALTKDDTDGYRKVFRTCGNAVLENFCREAQNMIGKTEAWESSVRKSRYRVNYRKNGRPEYAWHEDGPIVKASVSKTYGWGFRVFEDVDLDVRIDKNGVALASDPKKLANGIVEMRFPVFCTVCGYEISEEDATKALAMPDEKAAYESLVGAVRKARYDNGLSKVLPGYFNGEKMYAKRAAQVAWNYVRNNMVVELNVPFSEKDEAKRIGATWNETRKKWMISKSLIDKCKESWLKSK